METRDFTENRDRFFGGEIDVEDFNTYFPNKKRINKYVRADQFYDDLLTSKKQQEEMEHYKHMTLEQLRQLGKISTSDEKPDEKLTDETWQEEFKIRKLFVKPTSQKKLHGNYSKKSSCNFTNYQDYCWYINSVLDTIRDGDRDFCYFIYQVMELTRFHSNLKTRYIPKQKCWEVWL